MGRRTIHFTADAVTRLIKAARAAGVEVENVSVRPDGTIIINGEKPDFTEKQLDESRNGYL